MRVLDAARLCTTDLPGVCGGALEPRERAAAAGQAARGAAALQGGDPHLADVRRRLLEHGQHAEGDGGRGGRAALLHVRDPDQSGVRRRALEPRVDPQGLGQHPGGDRLVQDGAEAEARLPGRLLQPVALPAGQCWWRWGGGSGGAGEGGVGGIRVIGCMVRRMDGLGRDRGIFRSVGYFLLYSFSVF